MPVVHSEEVVGLGSLILGPNFSAMETSHPHPRLFLSVHLICTSIFFKYCYSQAMPL